MTDDADFIRRWSRRKQAARKGATTPGEPPEDDRQSPPDDDEQATADSATGRDAPDSEGETPELPDIDSLTTESDFKPFLNKGVPKELRNRALRKLWRVNPVFGHLDGLNDYDGDFTDSATVVKGLKTLYEVGRGFVPKADPEPAPETGDAPPDTADPPDIAATDATDETTGDARGETEDPASEIDSGEENSGNNIA